MAEHLKDNEALTFLLSRAIPDIQVTTSRVAWWIGARSRRRYFVDVYPEHLRYWSRFREKYPSSVQLALERGAESVTTTCPEFCSREDLLDWLLDVIGLSQGERNLLRLVWEL